MYRNFTIKSINCHCEQQINIDQQYFVFALKIKIPMHLCIQISQIKTLSNDFIFSPHPHNIRPHTPQFAYIHKIEHLYNVACVINEKQFILVDDIRLDVVRSQHISFSHQFGCYKQRTQFDLELNDSKTLR